MSEVTELGFLPSALAVHACRPVRGRPKLRISAFLTVKIDMWITRSTAAWRFLIRSLRNKTLLAGPRFDHRPVDSKVLVAEQVRFPRLAQHPIKECLCNIAGQQPIAVLGEDCHIPHGIIHV